MGVKFHKSANVLAGSQFLGTELSAAASKDTKRLQVKEIHLKMGSESKTWSIVKKFSVNGISVSMPLLGATSTASAVSMTGADADFSLLPGEQIEFVTTGATAAMQGRVVYEEVDNTPEKSLTDSVFTR